ncbi:MAG: hypothetical protein EZS28_038153 [Streblomastix strix]|uniref:DH domain-containing protein n=1 Tax=Streblomastix strix TaxID=222440 RepID=A0A5J4U8S2_9EUKA|nr:MAG: hypothetical protein EZS28_038153 [Streblomastix strix]
MSLRRKPRKTFDSETAAILIQQHWRASTTKIKKKFNEQKHSAEELLDSERNYVRQLQTLITKIQKPLVALSKKGVVEPPVEKVKDIFTYIEMIWGIHKLNILKCIENSYKIEKKDQKGYESADKVDQNSENKSIISPQKWRILINLKLSSIDLQDAQLITC